MERWLKEAGAVGLDDLEVTDFSIGGRGLRTLRQYKEGDKILTIPHTVLWTVRHAYAEPILGPVLRSTQPPLSVDDTLVIYILYVRSLESERDGPRSHIAALPTSYASSIFFTEDELEVCAGSSLYAITKRLQQQIEDDYKTLVVQLFTTHRDIFPLDKFTIEDYKWALCTVWSRAMDFNFANGDSIRLIAPFADMLNHSLETKQCHAYDTSSGDVSVLAGRNYDIEDQVFIYYGHIPNSRLLRLYGFVTPDNPNENFDLVLSTHPDAPLFELKHKLWLLAGLEPTTTISLTLDEPLPNKVLQYLRIQRLDRSELSILTSQQKKPASQKVSDINETVILEFLITSISDRLENFNIPLDKLEDQLTTEYYTSGGNMWAAAQVSLGEQRILSRTKESAQRLLVAITTGRGDGAASSLSKMHCANCKKAAEQLSVCSRCKSVRYCGQECQVAHYKEHKKACIAAVK